MPVRAPAQPLPGPGTTLAREAFLTSTTKRIMPVVQVNGMAVGDGQPGAVTKRLLQSLISREEKLLA